MQHSGSTVEGIFQNPGTSLNQYNHHWGASGNEASCQVELSSGQSQVINVTKSLGVVILANHQHHNVRGASLIQGRLHLASIGVAINVTATSMHHLGADSKSCIKWDITFKTRLCLSENMRREGTLDSTKDGGAKGEVVIRGSTLPVDCPATALVGEGVRRRPSHQDARVLGDRQRKKLFFVGWIWSWCLLRKKEEKGPKATNIVGIFKQGHRFTAQIQGNLAILSAANGGQKRRVWIGKRCFKQTQVLLQLQDPARTLIQAGDGHRALFHQLQQVIKERSLKWRGEGKLTSLFSSLTR